MDLVLIDTCVWGPFFNRPQSIEKRIGTDLTVAALALRTDSAVYTTDPHFDLIQGLKRFVIDA